MLTGPQFYARARWGDQWNVLRPDGSHHRGHDIRAAAGSQVPALRAGRVVSRGFSTVLGYYLVLQVARGMYDFYCHLRNKDRPTVGTDLAKGALIGSIAGPNDAHGTAWQGPHLHFGSGPTITSVTGGSTKNATTIVSAALTTSAGGTTPTPLPTRKKTRMATLFYTKDSKGNLFALAGDSPGTSANWLETRDQGLANALAVQYGNAAFLTEGSFAAWKARYLESVDIDVDALPAAEGGLTKADIPAIADAVADENYERLGQ